jgi:hypothetical protein
VVTTVTAFSLPKHQLQLPQSVEKSRVAQKGWTFWTKTFATSSQTPTFALPNFLA